MRQLVVLTMQLVEQEYRAEAEEEHPLVVEELLVAEVVLVQEVVLVGQEELEIFLLVEQVLLDQFTKELLVAVQVLQVMGAQETALQVEQVDSAVVEGVLQLQVLVVEEETELSTSTTKNAKD